jgi:hypothetical protein
MNRTMRMSVVVGVLSLFSLSGCAATGQARYVYQDGEFGVVGIPENTSRWPTFYREQAEALMLKHFPDGYDIVRAEEVEEGTRTLTLNGTNTAELDAGGATIVPMVKLLKLGRTASKSQADQLKIKECRNLYKRAAGFADEPQIGYASASDLGPKPYLDPNDEARRRIAAKPAPPSETKEAAKALGSDKPTETKTSEHAKPEVTYQ